MGIFAGEVIILGVATVLFVAGLALRNVNIFGASLILFLLFWILLVREIWKHED